MNNLSILIVDDQYNKIEILGNILDRIGLSREVIQHRTTLSAARKELNVNHYQILILDLKVPSNMGSPPKESDGVEFLRSLMVSSSNIHKPNYILGLTSVEERFEEFENDFIKWGWLLCKFSTQNLEWTYTVENVIRYQCTEQNTIKMYDIVVVTALIQPEFEELMNLDCNWGDFKLVDDPTLYKVGRIGNDKSNFSVIAAHATKKGMASAAALSMKMAIQFRPKFLIMTGICAGIRSKTKLGDVIIADPTWDLGSGKYKRNNGTSTFHIAPEQARLNQDLLTKLLEFKRIKGADNEIRTNWNRNTPGNVPELHIGPMATGSSVLADELIVQELKDSQHKDILAIEMEAYGVMSAMDYAMSPIPKALIIKSVCDYADGDKNDDWQRYAAFTSARTFYSFFSRLLNEKSECGS